MVSPKGSRRTHYSATTQTLYVMTLFMGKCWGVLKERKVTDKINTTLNLYLQHLLRFLELWKCFVIKGCIRVSVDMSTIITGCGILHYTTAYGNASNASFLGRSAAASRLWTRGGIFSAIFSEFHFAPARFTGQDSKIIKYKKILPIKYKLIEKSIIFLNKI